jgi:outer membrane putative beta-barrel porin/alpha-amylase
MEIFRDSIRIGLRRARRAAGGRTCAAALLLLLATVVTARAQDEPLVTDRPWAGESGRVVALGRTQFEGGFGFRLDRGTRTLSGPEFLLRVGLPFRTEFRLGLPDYERTSSSTGIHGHLADTYVGVKAQLTTEDSHYDFAVIPGFTAPADKNERGDAAPEIRTAWALPPYRGIALGGNLGRAWRERARRGSNAFIGTLSAARELRPGLSTFVEWVADVPDHGASSQFLHHGYTLAIYPDGQVDAHIGLGVSEAAPDFSVGVGFTVRH